MLNFLQIKNFTILEDTTIDFQSGFNVITGETGSGKSLVFDALHLILGARLSQNVIKPNRTHCSLTAQFNIDDNKEAKEYLIENGLNTEECVIKRLIYQNKPSKCEINGEIVSLKQLKQLTEKLIHIHSQHQSYKLVDSQYQKKIVDIVGLNSKLLVDIKKIHESLSKIEVEIEKLEAIALEQQDRLEIVNYHIEELDTLELETQSFSELRSEYNKQSESVKYSDFIVNSANLIRDDHNSIITTLEKIVISGQKFIATYPESNSYLELIDNAIIQLEEANSCMKIINNDNSYDPEIMSNLENQINRRQELARKHNTQAENLVTVMKELEQKKSDLLGIYEKLDELKEKAKSYKISYNKVAKDLAKSRRSAATKIEKDIDHHLKNVGFEKARFKIEIQHDENSFTNDGKDKVKFLFTANPGHDLNEIGLVASGGEISRLSLIIELITISDHVKRTLLFDEVDTGVSGKVARDIGQMLRGISQTSQIMCITHLPQIASLANSHFVVEKNIKANSTSTTVHKLNENEKISEVARLLGTGAMSENAIAQAKSLCLEN
ncbi:MAG: DNA repair protein RecN [Pseudomonadota bacterium]|nr:DNA repair protein RecN [Pseudomonadota bacterium]